MEYFAANYVRQSAARESGSEASTATQHAENLRVLERYSPARITDYEDLGRSAYKDDVVRKDFDRLIADCRAGRINLIAVMYLSRFTRRDPKEALPLLLELLRLGVVIVSATEGEFRDDDQNSVITLITLIMRLSQSYQESKNKSEHITRAKRLVKSLGGYAGGRGAFGFDMEKRTVINPEDNRPVQIQLPVHNAEQVAIIRDAVARIKAHMGTPIQPGKYHPGSLSGICIDFNNEGVPTRGALTGKKRSEARWHSEVLRRILVHPWLAGYACEVVYGTKPNGARSTRILGYEIIRDPETTMPVQICEPVIDPADWWQIQAWIKTRGRGRGRAQPRLTCLSGLRTPEGESILQCECGRPMNSANNGPAPKSASWKGTKPAYRCTRTRGGTYPGEHVGGNSITQAYLDNYLAERIFALISTAEGDPEVGDVLYAAARRYHEGRESPETFGERQALLAERADAVATLRDIAEAFAVAKSAIMRKSLMDQESVASDRLNAVERRLAELDELVTQPLPIASWLSSDNSSDPMAPGSWWSTTTVEDRREWFALFLDRVTVSKSATPRGGGPNRPNDTADRVTLRWAHEPHSDDSAEG
jgi:DNA invertase Pin-like site-specific DNA recombinase